jgi:hypothetical protein
MMGVHVEDGRGGNLEARVPGSGRYVASRYHSHVGWLAAAGAHHPYLLVLPQVRPQRARFIS